VFYYVVQRNEMELEEQKARITQSYLDSCDKEITKNGINYYSCPCNNCNGYLVKSYRRIKKHLHKYGPAQEETVQRIQKVTNSI
jgi:hypothetical protein